MADSQPDELTEHRILHNFSAQHRLSCAMCIVIELSSIEAYLSGALVYN
jgi:hypothetical protein